MSKIGKLPIEIKEGVTVSTTDNKVSVSGQKGSFTLTPPAGISVLVKDGKVFVSQITTGEESSKALFGLTRAQLANFITGVSLGFEKKLELSGVGYRAQINGT